ncbi:MAG: hypothetical protein K9L56_15600 [Clostridiales bacterium]|nr:hypothetical protein [Clostridiales bacterium]
MPDHEELTDDIEPGCNYGYLVAQSLDRQEKKIDDLHNELYKNGYVDDIRKLREFVEDKKQESQDAVEYKERIKVASYSGVIGAVASGVVTALLFILGIV